MKKTLLSLVAAATLAVPAFAQPARVRQLSTTAQTLNVEQLQTAEQTVQLNRFLFAGYNTLCLPMTLSAQQLQEAARDLRVERLAAMAQEGSTLNLYFVDCTADGIQAGVPYLVYSPTTQNFRARTSDVMGISTSLRPVTLTDQLGNRVSFSSSWQSLQGDGRYGIPAQQNVDVLESVLVRTTGEKTFLPTRCGFTWEEQANGATDLVIQHAGSLAALPTGIREQLTDNRQGGAAYDLGGRKVNGATRGIIVVDGNKVAVK